MREAPGNKAIGVPPDSLGLLTGFHNGARTLTLSLAIKTEPEDIEANASASTKPFKVMIVDDEEAIRDLISILLEEDGYDTVLAENGQKAIELYESCQPDLIITDMRMPRLSGVEMAEQLPLEESGTPIIFITGYTDYKALTQAIHLHPLGFLQKPFTPHEMRVLVKRACDLKAAETERLVNERRLQDGIEERTRELAFKTERLTAEKELLHGIVNHANFGLLALDSHQRIHLVNNVALNTLQAGKQKRALAFGALLEEVFESEILTLLKNQFELVMKQGTTHETEYWNETAMQKLSIVTYPINHAGEIVAIVYIIHDITEKDMLQKRLLQTAKLASIGELAAGVAHEINNPLGFVTSNCNTLSGYLESSMKYWAELEKLSRESNTASDAIEQLRKDYDVEYIEEDAKSLLGETLEGLERVSKIVVDLKSFARVDKQESEKASVNKLLEDALNLVRNETKYKLEIEKNLTELPEIDCYPSQLVQVFTNLFINASHATEEKGTLSITTSQRGKHVVIKVSDTGKGIPENILPRIFDPFFTTKEPGKGTGMGLSISYGIIEKHGGSITAESKVGKGTTFTISLPVSGSCSTGQPSDEHRKVDEIA